MPDNAFAKWLRARLGPQGVLVVLILISGPMLVLLGVALDGAISLFTGDFAPSFRRDIPMILATVGWSVVWAETGRLDRRGGRRWVYWLTMVALGVGIEESILRIGSLWHLLTDGIAASSGSAAMGILRVVVAAIPVTALGFGISRLIVPRSRRQQPDPLSPA